MLQVHYMHLGLQHMSKRTRHFIDLNCWEAFQQKSWILKSLRTPIWLDSVSSVCSLLKSRRSIITHIKVPVLQPEKPPAEWLMGELLGRPEVLVMEAQAWLSNLAYFDSGRCDFLTNSPHGMHITNMLRWRGRETQFSHGAFILRREK